MKHVNEYCTITSIGYYLLETFKEQGEKESKGQTGCLEGGMTEDNIRHSWQLKADFSGSQSA